MNVPNTTGRATILASIGRRLAARIIDCAIAVLIFFIVKSGADAVSAYVPAMTSQRGILSGFLPASPTSCWPMHCPMARVSASAC